MKKAFTLVELSIVLVVIGLLLVLAIKGKSLVESAKTKAEIARISQIEKAFRNFTDRYNFFPGYAAGHTNASQTIMLQHLVNNDYITNKDFEFDNGKALWRFIPCKYDTDRLTLSGANLALMQNGGMCIRLEDQAGNPYAASPKFICQVEVQIDDSNVRGGRGRWYRPAGGEIGDSPLKCQDIKSSDENVFYAYRIY